jgi:hypothetical protein
LRIWVGYLWFCHCEVKENFGGVLSRGKKRMTRERECKLYIYNILVLIHIRDERKSLTVQCLRGVGEADAA